MINIPAQTEWTEEHWKPGPLHTRTHDYHALEYWQSVYGPNTRVEVNVEQDKTERDNFMGHLRSDIPIIVYPDPEYTGVTVHPLCELHKAFFDAASTLMWELYPSSINGRRSRKGDWHSPVHSALSHVYWDTSCGPNNDGSGYTIYTPQQWALLLNRWLDIVRENPVRSEYDLQQLHQTLKDTYV